MANRIREVRNSKHMTLEELAEAAGVSGSNLSRIESGSRGLSLETAIKVARALGCEVTDISDEFSEEDIIAGSRVAREPAPKGDVPNLTIHAGMGAGRIETIEGSQGGFVPGDFTEGYWSFPGPVKEGFRHLQQTHALPVIGDSMEPTLRDGSVVFVDTSHVIPSPPDLYAVDYGDGLMVKRIELVPRTQKVLVISDNSTRYKSYELDRSDLMVFGRVVASFQWRG